MPKQPGLREQVAGSLEKAKGKTMEAKEELEITELIGFAENLDEQVVELTAELKEYWVSEECTTKHHVEEPKWFEKAA